MLKDFRDFAMRGNVLDLAIAVIIGAAFGKIVSSLVADVIMPPIGLALGGMDFSSLALTLQQASVNEAGEVVAAVTLNYGMFIQNVFDFLIVAFCIFMMIRGMSRLQKKKEAAPAAPPVPSNEEKLLAEIRDALRAR